MRVAPGICERALFANLEKSCEHGCRLWVPPFYCPLACAPRQSQTMRIAIARSPANWVLAKIPFLKSSSGTEPCRLDGLIRVTSVYGRMGHQKIHQEER